MSADEVANGLGREVRGEYEEARGDRPLRTSLGGLGLEAAPSEQPDDHEAGEGLDQAVGSEADERDRARCDARADRDPELDEMPGDPAPSEEPGSSLQPGARTRRGNRQAAKTRGNDRRFAHPRSVVSPRAEAVPGGSQRRH